jgi:uncharacterized protein YdhG (YjbR/CyaY superfamily)
MPTTPNTVDFYITAAPESTQPILRQLREIIRSVVPDAEETISYGMPCYRYHGRLAYFAAHTHHVGLYALGPASDYPAALKTLTVGKGTIRLDVDQPIPTTLIRNLVASCAARMQAARQSAAQRRPRKTRRGHGETSPRSTAT